MRLLELKYLSPISNFNFNIKDHQIILVLTTTTKDNKVFIYKARINVLDNITKSVRAFPIGLSIQIPSPLIYPNFCVSLYSYNKITKKLFLMFHGQINIDKVEYGNKSYIKLYTPPPIRGKVRHTIFKNNLNFLDEPLYNFEDVKTNSYCTLFYDLVKRRVSEFNLVKPVIAQIDNYDNNTYIFNRYHNMITKEYYPPLIEDTIKYVQEDTGSKMLHKKHFIHQVKFLMDYIKGNKDYHDLVKDYQLDETPYYKLSEYKRDHFRRKIISTYRQDKVDPYLNNIIISPLDCRVRGFRITPNLNFVLYNSKMKMVDLIKKHYELKNGSGFYCRTNPQDYNRFVVPYQAYLTEIAVIGNPLKKGVVDIDESVVDEPFIMVLKFESNYFVPPTVKEREYISVIYGNNINVSRGYPDLVNPQPETKLIYYLILVGPVFHNSIALSNTKLLNMENIIKMNHNNKIKDTWFAQGEELGFFEYKSGSIIMLCNRPINFTEDITHYSGLYPSIRRPIETYVHAKDVIGGLE